MYYGGFFCYGSENDYYFEIPFDSLGISFLNGENYIYTLEKNGVSLQDISVTIGGLTQEDIEYNQNQALIQSNKDTQQAIQEQTDAINKQTQATQEQTDKLLSEDTGGDITSDDLGVSMPTIDGSPDLTNIFDLFYNSFMSVYEGENYNISFGIPGYENSFNFSIPSDLLTSMLPSGILVFIQSIYWVILGGFVLKSINKIIHDITTMKENGGSLNDLTYSPTDYILFNILK